MSLDQRDENPDLAAPRHAKRAKKVLLEIELGGTRRLPRVVTPRIERTILVDQPESHCDGGVLEQLQTSRKHGGSAGAAGLPECVTRGEQGECAKEYRKLAWQCRSPIQRRSAAAPRSRPCRGTR